MPIDALINRLETIMEAAEKHQYGTDPAKVDLAKCVVEICYALREYFLEVRSNEAEAAK